MLYIYNFFLSFNTFGFIIYLIYLDKIAHLLVNSRLSAFWFQYYISVSLN